MESTTQRAATQVDRQQDRQKVCSLYERLQQIPDGRKARGKRYEAAIVLTLLALVKLAGETNMGGIAEWARLRSGWLREVLPARSEKLPCANTYQYVCDHIDQAALNAAIEAYTASCAAQSAQASGDDKRQWRQMMVDGKVLRGSDHQAAPGRAAKMVVSAYEVEARRVCKQVEVAKKGNEPQAAMRLIEQLNLQGYVVSADALHTRPQWCRAVRQRGGHYLLIVKGNRQELYDDIALLFEAGPSSDLPEQRTQTVDKKHGRLEVRTLRISSALADHLKPDWPDIAQVFQIQRRVTKGRNTTCECAYGLTSLTADDAPPHQVIAFIRHHWHVENVLH